jgi:hypothetical protein
MVREFPPIKPSHVSPAIVSDSHRYMFKGTIRKGGRLTRCLFTVVDSKPFEYVCGYTPTDMVENPKIPNEDLKPIKDHKHPIEEATKFHIRYARTR